MPRAVDLVAEGCKDTVLVDTGDVFLESQGRILQLDVTVKMCAQANGWRLPPF